MKVGAVALRGVLDSRAEVTVEADVVLDDGRSCHRGRGSCARAIAPGRLERSQGRGWDVGPLAGRPDVDALVAAIRGADALDPAAADDRAAAVRDSHGLGTDVTVAVSLALARARARWAGHGLVEELAERAGTRPGLPRLLVNVFSGGIHSDGPPDRFQQIMAVPRTGALLSDVDAARRVWAAAATLAAGHAGAAPPLSASSGMVLDAPTPLQLDLLDAAIEAAGLRGRVDTGVDVAAEHLSDGPGCYRFDGARTDARGLADLLAARALRGSLTYVEDPFDPAEDPGRWADLDRAVRGRATVVGDDLFASDPRRVDAGLAGGLLLKPSQAGTVTELLRAAAAARAAGMELVVSHRSGETEDTAVCDLAVALGAEFLKIGGPRRGDRVAKYNQLLRLSEQLPSGTPTTVGRRERTMS